jgi:hypothetical protein
MVVRVVYCGKLADKSVIADFNMRGCDHDRALINKDSISNLKATSTLGAQLASEQRPAHVEQVADFDMPLRAQDRQAPPT